RARAAGTDPRSTSQGSHAGPDGVPGCPGRRTDLAGAGRADRGPGTGRSVQGPGAPAGDLGASARRTAGPARDWDLGPGAGAWAVDRPVRPVRQPGTVPDAAADDGPGGAASADLRRAGAADLRRIRSTDPGADGVRRDLAGSGSGQPATGDRRIYQASADHRGRSRDRRRQPAGRLAGTTAAHAGPGEGVQRAVDRAIECAGRARADPATAG